MKNNFAYCGFDCSFCPNFNKTCLGCKSNKVCSCCNNCFIKECCNKKQIENCAFCKEFPCDYIKQNLSSRSLEYLYSINKLIAKK